MSAPATTVERHTCQWCNRNRPHYDMWQWGERWECANSLSCALAVQQQGGKP